MAELSSILGSAGIGGAIGKAIVSLELDTKKYTAEMKAAQGQTVASTNAMAQSTSKFGGLAATAFKAAAVGAVAFAAYSVKAAVEANDAQLKLQNTFANNPKLADSSAEAFTRQADALRDLTGVDDEAIITGQALLGSFKLTGEQVMQLTPLVVDLSEKYNIDLQTAFKAVGKATAGSSGALSRFGVVLDANKLSADAYGTTLEGLGIAQGFAAKSAEQEPWRVLGAQFEEIAEQVGQALLPLLQDLSEVIRGLLPILKVAAENLDVLLAVFIGYGALKWLPGLLLSIATALTDLGAVAAAAKVLSLAEGVTAMGTAFGVAAAAATAFAVAFVGLTAALAAWDPLGLVDDTDKLSESMTVNTKAFGDSEVMLGRVAVSQNLLQHATESSTAATDGATTAANAEAQAKEAARVAADSYVGSLQDQAAASDTATTAADEQAAGLRRVLEATLALFDPTFALIHAVEDNAAAEKELTDARRDLNRLAQDGKQDTDAYREAHERYKDAVLGAAESQADLITSALALRQAVQEGKTNLDAAVRSIRDIGKAAGLSKTEIATLAGIVRKGLTDAANVAESLAPNIGANITAGIKAGLDAGASGIYTTITSIVNSAVNAANIAAGARSPSKKMIKLGLDMMTGLWQGITDGAQKVIDAAKKATQKLIDGFEKDLAKVKGLAQSFADTIKGAFSGFQAIGSLFTSAVDQYASAQEKYADEQAKFAEDQKKYAEDQKKYLTEVANYQIALTKRSGDMPWPTAPTAPTAPTGPTAPGAAPNLSDILQAQVSAATQLADVLEALKRQGAGKALLGQVAEAGVGFGQALLAGGPAQIEEANEALKTIAKLASETGKGLSEQFFGKKIDSLERKLDKQNDLMKELIAIEKLGHEHAIILDGEKVSTTNERGLTRILDRKGSLFNGAVRSRP